MEVNIYIDVFFLLNLIVNFCLILACGMLFHNALMFQRFLLSAAFGGVMNSTALLVQMTGYVGGIQNFRVLIAFVMARIAYGKKNVKSTFLEVLCLFFLSFGAEGFIRFTHSMCAVFGIPLICFLLSRERKERKNYVMVRLFFKGRSVELKGFHDTGNRLKEPVTGCMVHIASYDSVKEILPDAYRQVVEYYFETGLLENTKVTKLQMYEFTFLSYHSIGKETGQLLGIRMDSAVFSHSAGKKTEEKAVIALTNQKKLMGNHCQIIINGRLEI